MHECGLRLRPDYFHTFTLTRRCMIVNKLSTASVKEKRNGTSNIISHSNAAVKKINQLSGYLDSGNIVMMMMSDSRPKSGHMTHLHMCSNKIRNISLIYYSNSSVIIYMLKRRC